MSDRKTYWPASEIADIARDLGFDTTKWTILSLETGPPGCSRADIEQMLHDANAEGSDE